MVTKLELYNGALGHLGPTRLADLDENRPDRYELDAAWDSTCATMLASGLWRHALRTQQLGPDEDVGAAFGLAYAYPLPDDWVRLRLISPNEDQRDEDMTFRIEAGYIRSAHAELFVTYVSDDEDFGMDMAQWPALFCNAFEAELAYKSGLPITKEKGTKNDLLIVKKRMLLEAKRVHAVDERVKGKPLSSWATSRLQGGRPQQRRSSLSSE